MRRWLTAPRHSALVLALTAAAWAPGSHAGLFDDEEARQRIEQVRKTVQEMQTQADTLRSNQIDFANQLEALRTELAKLRGQVEVLSYDLDTTQKRQQDFYVDLDNRLRKLESPEGAAATANAEPSVPTPSVPDTDAYEKAVTTLKAGKAKEASAAFDAFILGYPKSKLIGGAHYWGAYARSQAKDYRGAAALFAKFAENWPDDPRAPDAMEAQADNLLAARDAAGARTILQRLVDKYPNSDAGKRARQELKKK